MADNNDGALPEGAYYEYVVIAPTYYSGASHTYDHAPQQYSLKVFTDLIQAEEKVGSYIRNIHSSYSRDEKNLFVSQLEIRRRLVLASQWEPFKQFGDIQ